MDVRIKLIIFLREYLGLGTPITSTTLITQLMLTTVLIKSLSIVFKVR